MCRTIGLAVFVNLLVGCFGSVVAQADPVADFYRGKRITVAVGTGPVGTYAQYTRLLVQHMPRFMPGQPSFVFQTMPGAGGLIASNNAYNIFPKDGTQLLVVGQNYAIDQALLVPNVRYDARRFNIVGRFTDNATVALGWKPAGVTSLQVLRQRVVNTGGVGPSSPTDIFPALLNAVAETKFKVISSYKGLDELMLAMQRGETEAMVTSLQSLRTLFESVVREDKISILVQFSSHRHAAIADVPTAGEMSTSKRGRQVADFVGSGSDIGRTVIAPPDVPTERLNALRVAFAAMADEAEFRTDAAKQGLEVNPLPVGDLNSVVESTLNAPKAVVDTARHILSIK
jgi:tripartite-type tricarboxylate transporter receptor subunit TctC